MIVVAFLCAGTVSSFADTPASPTALGDKHPVARHASQARGHGQPPRGEHARKVDHRDPPLERAGHPNTHADVEGRHGTRSDEALAVWRQLQSLPAEPIDDPLGSLVYEAGAMRRVAMTIQTLRSQSGDAALDPRLQVALLRSLYLAASIDGSDPGPLLRLTAEMRDMSNVPRVRAEAAYRILMNDLMRPSAGRRWNAPLTAAEFNLLDAYVTCYGDSPRAASADKRLAEDAATRRNATDLRACRRLLNAAAPNHPVGRAFDGKARGIEAIGQSWSPALRTANGAALAWSQLRGKPVVLLLVDVAQTPSAELLTALGDSRSPDDEEAYSLVVVQVGVTAEPARPAKDIESQSDAGRLLAAMPPDRRVHLARGWREPLLAEFDIRTLPVAFVVDGDGTLRRILRHDNWSMAKWVHDALREIKERDEAASQPSTRPARDD